MARTAMDDEARRRIFIAKQNAGNGKGGPVIFDSTAMPNNFDMRRPSGIMQLDIDTGGGLPTGAPSVIAGPDNAGKTMLLYHYYALAQRIYGERCCIAHAPVEGPPDYMFMRKCGYIVALPEPIIDRMDEKRVRRGLPKLTKEERKELRRQVGNFDIFHHPVGEKLFDLVLDAIDANFYQFVGVDSVQAVQSEAEMSCESLTDHPQQAADAVMLTRFFKKYFDTMFPKDGELRITSLVLISQVRGNRKKSEASSFMAKFIPDYVATGAWALKHGKFIEIMLSPGSKIKKGKDKSETLGKVIKWYMTKAKGGSHDNVTGEVDFEYETLLDVTSTLLTEAVKLGLITESKTEVLVRRTYGGTPLAKYPNMQALRDALEADIDLNLDLRIEVLEAAGVKECVYR